MGERGLPGIPGDVSTISTVLILHMNLLYDESVWWTLCWGRGAWSWAFSAVVCSSQVANVIPEPGEPVSILSFILHSILYSTFSKKMFSYLSLPVGKTWREGRKRRSRETRRDGTLFFFYAEWATRCQKSFSLAVINKHKYRWYWMGIELKICHIRI